MAEPTKLLSAGDLERLESTEANVDVRVAAIANSFATLTAERDAALARVAELEAEKERQAGLSSGGASPSAYQHAIDRADALDAELAELRAASRAVLEPVHSTVTDEERLRKLLAQPQGERGAALLAALTEIAHYGVSVPLEMSQSQYDASAARDMRRIAQAAIDGATS